MNTEDIERLFAESGLPDVLCSTGDDVMEHLYKFANLIEQHLTQWQPMETAPKDFIEIFVADEFRDYMVAWFAKGMWIDDRRHEVKPICWMPLPPLPESEK